MASKILISLCLVLAAVSTAKGQLGNFNPPAWGGPSVNPWLPPWEAPDPWFPQRPPCSTTGAICVDCTTKLVCTKVGGLQKACTDPTLPYCNLGECSATPTAECALATAAA